MNCFRPVMRQPSPSRSAVALGHRHTEDAELAELANDVERQRALALGFLDPAAKASGPVAHGAGELAIRV